MSAFDHLTLAIRHFHDSGNTTTMRAPLAVLVALFDRLGRHEAAATIAGFALSPFTALSIPEISTAIAHLRDVLGDQTYESLARKGETMTTAEMADLRIRPNRPGPSRTERRLEIDHICDNDWRTAQLRILPGGGASKVRLTQGVS